jgi:tRNA dimethylallyltransferase
MKPKILVVVGPTSSGKSDLAVQLAKELNGEVVSADSRQVYSGLDIGTGKVTKEEMGGIPHHLLDVADPQEIFTVVDFQRLAHKAIDDIISRGKVPILAGGTGFYIQSIVDGIILPEVPENKELREKLNNLSLEKLQSKLKELDPGRYEDIDEKNKVRLVRAIEIATHLGKVPKVQKDSKYDSVQIGINWPKEELSERIKQRLLDRMDAGLIEEVENLHTKGLSYERMEELGLEYRYVSRFLRKEISKKEMIEQLTFKIIQYAKRQMTWIKKDPRINWFPPNSLDKVLEFCGPTRT